MKERRILKINELLKRTLSEIIEKEIGRESGTLLTLTRAEVSDDLKTARVWLSIFPPSKAVEVLGKIEKTKNTIEKSLNQKISLRFFLKLKFFIDKF